MEDRDNFRIMFVENNQDQRELIEFAAEKLPGTFCLIKEGGRSALEHLERYKYDFDAVVIDLKMPRMSGMELTKQIRINEKLFRQSPIPIFWFSGYPVDLGNKVHPIAEAYHEYAVRRIFPKPYDDVFDIIEQVRQDVQQ